eukprot:XP_019918142.1 PREDICTED: uncharacterized protein LOC105348884 [Crassostrea gigas]
MESLSRGKLAVKYAVEKMDKSSVKPKGRRISPDQDAMFWCNAGLDKDGFETRFINKAIGHGVFTTQRFAKGSFLLEYAGERLSAPDGENREKRRRQKHRYMYYYCWNGNRAIDATNVKNRFCRYVNDSEKGNASMKLKIFNNYPRLCLYASGDIDRGEEVRYNYGNKDAPWREKFKVERSSSDESDDDPFDVANEAQANMWLKEKKHWMILYKGRMNSMKQHQMFSPSQNHPQMWLKEKKHWMILYKGRMNSMKQHQMFSPSQNHPQMWLKEKKHWMILYKGRMNSMKQHQMFSPSQNHPQMWLKEKKHWMILYKGRMNSMKQHQMFSPSQNHPQMWLKEKKHWMILYKGRMNRMQHQMFSPCSTLKEHN